MGNRWRDEEQYDRQIAEKKGGGERQHTANASGFTPFSISETLRESWERVRLVF